MNATAVGRRRGILILTALVVTFIVVRLWLWFTPDADFDLGTYNIHHLYTGLILLSVTGLPLMVDLRRNRWLDLCCIGFGAGLSLALDEVIYLIATDGSNASYWLPASVWGGIVVVGLSVVYLGVLIIARGKPDQDR